MARAFVFASAIFWGLSGGLAGILLTRGWDPLVISYCRGAVGLVVVLVWLGIVPTDSGLSDPRMWLWSSLAGLGVAGNFTFFFISIAHGSVAVAATLMYTAPIFVYLISFVLKIEKPTLKKGVAVGLVMIGVVLLTGLAGSGAENVTLVGVGAGILSGLCYTVFIFAFNYAAKLGSPQAILTVAFSALVVALFLPGDGEQIALVTESRDWPLFAALGVFGGGGAFILYVIGLEKTPPAVASVLAMLEPVTASLFGVLVLGESLTSVQLVGMALVLFAVTGLSAASGGRET